MRLLDPRCPWIDAAAVQAEFDRVFRKDRLGHWLHLGCAMFWCFVASWPVSFAELGAIPLWLAFLGRQHNIWRMWGHTLAQPVSLAAIAFAAWQAVTLLWTPSLHEGLHELSSLRWAWAIVFLWPVIDRRDYLIAAFAAGFVCGHATQIAQAVGVAMGAEWLNFGRAPDRISGWWNPVAGGIMLCGALGLHLPAAVMGRGAARRLGIAASVLTIAGILATGTRGAWIAAGALVAIVLAVAAGRAVRAERRPGGRGLVLGAGVAALVVAALWLGVGDSVARRFERARDEVRAAIDRGDYASDTGARILMARWALEALREHPLGGVGVGGYHAWVVQRATQRGESAERVHSHAHSAPLHIAATSGLAGLALAGVFALAALRGGFAGLTRETLGTYQAGPGFALAGLFLASAFDPIHLTTQVCADLFLLCALCTLSRPALLTGRAAAAPAEGRSP